MDQQNRPSHRLLSNPPSGDYTSNQDYLKKVDHDAEMKDVRERLDAIESRIKDSPALVCTVKDLLENDRNIDPVMTKYIEEHVDFDPIVQTAVDRLDKRTYKAFMKRAGLWIIGAVWSVALIVATAWISVTITNANQPKDNKPEATQK